MKKKTSLIVSGILVVIILICLIFIGRHYLTQKQNEKVYDNLASEVQKTQTEQKISDVTTETEEQSTIDFNALWDVNPDIYGEFLSLNVDEDNSAIDFDLAIEAAPYYEISTEQAKKNVTAIRKTVADNWRSLAGKYGISRGEIERMCPAFQGDV